MFCHITRNWRGQPLISHEVIINLIAYTTTKTGLKIRAVLQGRSAFERLHAGLGGLVGVARGRHGSQDLLVEPPRVLGRCARRFLEDAPGVGPKRKGAIVPPFKRLLRDGLLRLRLAGGVPAPTRILAVGARGRTELLTAYVNRRLLTGTRATAASDLRILFHACHINLHETLVSKNGLARSMPL